MDKKIERQVERRKLILSGNIWKTILIICFPIMLYQFINSLSTIIDQMITAGISAEASNAVGSTAQIKNMFSAFGGGLASGGAVLVARYYGAGSVHDARNASGNLLCLGIILNVIILLIFLPLAEPVMRICQVSDNAIEIGLNYFRLQLVELIFVTTNSIFIGLEKAKGNMTDDEIFELFKEEIYQMNRKLASYKRVKDIIIRKTDFVRTTTRKIKRQENI